MLFCGLTVLMSIQIRPSPRPARIPSAAGGDLVEHGIVGKGGDDDLGFLRNRTGRLAPFEPVLDQLLGVLSAALPARDGIPRGEEPLGHVPAHVPEADEADAGAGRVHVVRLPSSTCAVDPTV